MPNSLTRRDFLGRTGLVLAAAPLLTPRAEATPPAEEDAFRIHLFSKHAQFLDYADLARTAADLGFEGLDLTVRPGGHVEPERVQTDLPRATDAIRKVGLQPLMMTTAINDPADPVSRKILETAAREGIRYYRMAWFQYPPVGSLPEALAGFRRKVAGLAELNQRLGLHGAYQNHAGTYVGASLWEIYDLLRDVPPAAVGCQYDIRHATVEGGMSWKTGLRLMAPRINSLDIKDFRWETDGHRSKLVNTPLGEGTVDFPGYFQLVKQYGIRGPISLHFEYDLGGAEAGNRNPTMAKDAIFAAMRRDVQTLKQLLGAAGLR
jgi:sugar phosphate isomerase/epimerase